MKTILNLLVFSFMFTSCIQQVEQPNNKIQVQTEEKEQFNDEIFNKKFYEIARIEDQDLADNHIYFETRVDNNRYGYNLFVKFSQETEIELNNILKTQEGLEAANRYIKATDQFLREYKSISDVKRNRKYQEVQNKNRYFNQYKKLFPYYEGLLKKKNMNPHVVEEVDPETEVELEQGEIKKLDDMQIMPVATTVSTETTLRLTALKQMITTSTDLSIDGGLLFVNGEKESLTKAKMKKLSHSFIDPSTAICTLLNSNKEVKTRTHLIEKDITGDSIFIKLEKKVIQNPNKKNEVIMLDRLIAHFPDGYTMYCAAATSEEGISVEKIQKALGENFLVEEIL